MRQYHNYNKINALSMEEPIRIIIDNSTGITGFVNSKQLAKWLEYYDREELYEYLYDVYRKMYIDYDSSPQDDVDPKELVEYLQYIVADEVDGKPEQIRVDCYTSNRHDKTSYHLVVQGYAFHYLHCKQMARKMKVDYPAVDLLPYGPTQRFRLYSSYKKGRQDGVKTHINDKGEVKLEKRILNSLIQRTKGLPEIPFTPPPVERDPEPVGELGGKVYHMIVEALSAKRSEDYENWMRVGMAMKHSGFTLDHFDRFSQKSDKYEADQVARWWDRAEPNGMIGMRTLLGWAIQDERDYTYGKDDTRYLSALGQLKAQFFPKKRLARRIEEREEVKQDYDSLIRKWHKQDVYMEEKVANEYGEDVTKVVVNRWQEFFDDWTKCLVYILDDKMKVSWACCRISKGKERWCMGGYDTPAVPKTWKVRVNEKDTPIVAIINNNTDKFPYATGYQFNPTTTELLVDGKLNSFSGLEATPVRCNDEGDIAPFLDHIRYVFANDNEESYNWIVKWYAWIVQKRCKAKVAMVLYSEGQQTTGKSLFNEHFAKYIIGRQYFAQYSSVSNLFERFNIDQMTHLFVVLDEAIFSGSKADADKLKSMITQGDMRYEVKGGLVIPNGYNYANYAILTNNLNPVHVEDKDRRYALFHCNETWCEGGEYFSFLADCFTDPELVGKFTDYLMGIDLTGWDAQRTIPMTEYKRDVLSISKDPLSSWWEDVLEGMRLERGQWYPTQVLFDDFEQYCVEGGYKKDYITIRKLSLFVKNKGCQASTRRPDGKAQKRGYTLGA